MYDVIVVGARCAGSAIAMLLARRGYRVLLVDRDTFPSDMEMSTHLIHQRGVARLGRWGVLDAVVAAGSRRIYGCMIEMGPIQLTGPAPAVDGEDGALAPRRMVLDAILIAAAVRSGAQLREGCQVETLREEGGRVVGVKGRTATGGTLAAKARIVVGADGPSSRVAACVRAPKYNAKPALQGTAWIYWNDVPMEHFELHLGAYQAVYAFPTDKGSTLIGVNWAIDRFRSVRRNVEHEYFNVLHRLAPQLAERTESAHRTADKTHLGATRNFFRKAYGPGWVLLGDAHYTKDPCTAQGITDAFCDAEHLADAIDHGLCGERGLDEVLLTYEKGRVAWATPFYELTCELAKFAPPTPDKLELYSALQGNRRDTEAFLGTVSEAVSPTDFFAPDNLARILRGG